MTNAVAKTSEVTTLPITATMDMFDALPPRVKRALWGAVVGDWSPFDAMDLVAERGEEHALWSLREAERADMKAMRTPCWRAKVPPLDWRPITYRPRRRRL